jgi:carboxypeptidase Q
VAAAHLDSWDLAPGTVDDGVGVAAVLEAAKAITSRGIRPQRTIRFVLFTGEEQGLLGSRAYVREHEKELQDHVAAVVLDDGQGPITQIHLAGHDSLLPAFRSFIRESTILDSVKVDSSFALFTDAYSFTLAGLPGISFGQNSPGYAKLHHSNADTLDKVDASILARNSAVLALTCFWIADRTGRVEKIWSKEKTARILAERKQRRILAMLGMGL